MATIDDAVERFQERAAAIAVSIRGGRIHGDSGEIFRMLISGYDLDPERTLDPSRAAATKGIEGLLAGVAPDGAFGGTWVEGLMVGIAYAELRSRQAAAA